MEYEDFEMLLEYRYTTTKHQSPQLKKKFQLFTSNLECFILFLVVKISNCCSTGEDSRPYSKSTKNLN